MRLWNVDGSESEWQTTKGTADSMSCYALQTIYWSPVYSLTFWRRLTFFFSSDRINGTHRVSNQRRRRQLSPSSCRSRASCSWIARSPPAGQSAITVRFGHDCVVSCRVLRREGCVGWMETYAGRATLFLACGFVSYGRPTSWPLALRELPSLGTRRALSGSPVRTPRGGS